MFDAVLHVGRKEDADAVGVVAQQIIRTASNDDTASAAGKFTDQSALYTDQLSFGGDIVESSAAASVSDRKNILHKIHRAFVDAGKVRFVHIQLLGCAG